MWHERQWGFINDVYPAGSWPDLKCMPVSLADWKGMITVESSGQYLHIDHLLTDQRAAQMESGSTTCWPCNFTYDPSLREHFIFYKMRIINYCFHKYLYYKVVRMKGFNKYKARRSKILSNFIIVINYYYDYYCKGPAMLFYIRIGSAPLFISGDKGTKARSESTTYSRS